MTDIVLVDPHDDQALRAWYDASQSSIVHDRPMASSETFSALANSLRIPSPYTFRTLLAARDGDATVGTVDLRMNLQDNLHLADLEVHVRPDRRRRGVGRALHDAADEIRREAGRTTVCGELHVAAGEQDPAGLAFANALGFAGVHEEHHLVLSLPADPAAMDRLRRSAHGYDVVTWGSHCPDDHLASFCRMRTQMERDLPLGEVAYAPPVVDEARLRTQEQRLARSYHQVVSAARCREDGEMAGYSIVLLAHDDREALQEDTLVMPDHRGHGLGLHEMQRVDPA